MQNLERLAAQRKTMESLGSIFRTLKTLSAVMVKQVDARQSELAQFDQANWLSLTAVLQALPPVTGAVSPDIGRPAWIVIGAERGFCGRFNERVLAFAASEMHAGTGTPRLISVGSRLSEKSIEEGLHPEKNLPLPATPQGLEPLLQKLLQQVDQWQSNGVGQINALYTRRTDKRALPLVNQVLWPIPLQRLQHAQQASWPTRQRPLILADKVEAMQIILRQVLKTSLLMACMSSMLCESSARLANLQIAEENINQRLDELKQMHNTLRQSAITAELQDITAAFDLVASRAPT